MKALSLVHVLVIGALLSACGGEGDTAARPAQSRTPAEYGYRVVRTYPHDPSAFTEGLIYDEGALYESTGMRGRSTLRKVELATGKVLDELRLAPEYFGEGLALWQDELIQLTFRSQVGFVYERDGFRQIAEFAYPTEGWGLTDDETHLIMSDGTATLRFLDPETFQETGRLVVREPGGPVENLNELEYVDGEIYANIWQTDRIARISPDTGEVLAWIDLTGLAPEPAPAQPMDVLNGIAYDAAGDRLFVTGKYWPELFEIDLVARE